MDFFFFRFVFVGSIKLPVNAVQTEQSVRH